MASLDKLKKFAKVSKWSGLTSICYFFNRNRKRIIAYHNVIPDKYWDNSLHLKHSMKESSFRKQIEVINKKFHVSLDLDDKKSVTLTFDDGYLNQGLVASEILDENNINGYFFCVEDLINRNKALDMDLLQYWISYIPLGNYLIKEINLEIIINSNEDREIQWEIISNKLDEGISLRDMRRFLDNSYSFNKLMQKEHKGNEMYDLRFLAIGLEKIEDMKRKGHKIGAHSSKHKRLSKLNKDELKEDIKICNQMMRKVYNTEVFCYPYGSIEDVTDDVIKEVKKNGFKKALAYSNSPLKNGQYNEYFIPRIFLPDTNDEDVIDFILSGAKHFMLFRKLFP